MVFNATFNNISVIYNMVEETRVPRENYWPVVSHWQTLSHNVVSSTPGDRFTKVIVNRKSKITLKISLRAHVYVRFTKLVLSLRVTTCDK